MVSKIDSTTKIVCIGGGTGTYTVLSGLKKYTDQLSAIVSMADTGGSARKERDEFGLLPSSDIRKSLVALADTSSEKENLLRELFQFRFDQGVGLSGMAFGNLFLVALTKLLGSQVEAIKKAGQILRIKGRVIPVTLDKIDLVAIYENGLKVVGEHFIDEPEHDGMLKVKKLTTIPKALAHDEAVLAIKEADLIILGPGSFYTTLIANLVVKGIPEAICQSKGKKIFILNLMTEPGQTAGFTAMDHIRELQKYILKRCLNYVLVNTSSLPRRILEKYTKTGAHSVIDDVREGNYFKVVRGEFFSPREVKRGRGDNLKRSFIRHDGNKLARAIVNLL